MQLKDMSKKGILDYVYYKLGNQFDFYVCGTYAPRKFTKWKKYSEAVMCIDEVARTDTFEQRRYFEQINQRQILPNEIVLDLEEPERIKGVVDKIKSWGWECSVFETGSRGYHIHIIAGESFNEKEKEAVVRKLGTDIQKCSDKNLIALEYCPHWKTGKLKREVLI